MQKKDALTGKFMYNVTMHHILEKLNPSQREAVMMTEGPLLVIAGAGSGKTRVLTCRVAYILASRLASPSDVLAVTFTNKAANEMRERIKALLNSTASGLIMSTFHSFCARLLRTEAAEIGYPSNFAIFDEDDALSMIKNCLKELDILPNQFPPPSLRRKISAAKNRLEDAEEYARKAEGYFETRTAKVYSLYEQRLSQCGAFDFDDLILRTVKLLTSRADIREKYQRRFRYILVDEYQDTNHSQYQLLKLLNGPSRNICVVGDEDQSIYGWRGADISNILNFENDFPGAKVIKLERNYRSTEIILKAASAVIANNTSRKGKTLWTEAESGDPVRLFLTENASQEALVVIEDIERNIAAGSSLNQSVILYRTNAQSRPFEEILRKKNIPYQIVGGLSFYQRREIKDLVAYLKLIANPNDDIALQRIINYPKRGIGQSSLDKLAEYARLLNKPMYYACLEVDGSDALGSRPKQLIRPFIEFIRAFQSLKAHLDIAGLTRKLVDDLRLAEYLIEEDPLVGRNRVENVEEFIAAAKEFAAGYQSPTLDNFLAEISLYTDIDEYDEVDDKLTLMTLHSAKGLEFDSVYIVGLEEGLFPISRAIEEPMELEEERRLFYVGVTRARRNLQLSLAASRNRFGGADSIPSRFLKELPPSLVETSDFRNKYYRAGGGDSSTGEASQKVDLQDSESSYEYEDSEIMRIGRIVQHPSFGRGTILKVEGRGESMRLEVSFRGIGIKRIVAKYAKLKVIG
jgi:DNA helicase-2/ATP-dependent DNA helicase PcrA